MVKSKVTTEGNVNTITFHCNPSRVAEQKTVQNNVQIAQGKTTTQVMVVNGRMQILSSETGNTIETIIDSFSNTLDGKPTDDPVYQSMVGLTTQMYLDKEAKAVKVSGFEPMRDYFNKMIEDMPKDLRPTMRPRIEKMAEELISGKSQIAAWNNRMYFIASKTIEINVPTPIEMSMPFPATGSEITLVGTMTVKRSSECPSKQCALLVEDVKADTVSLGQILNGLVDESVRDFDKGNSDEQDIKKAVPTSRKATMISRSKTLIDPSNMTVYRVDSVMESSFEMGEIGKFSTNGTGVIEYSYPSTN